MESNTNQEIQEETKFCSNCGAEIDAKAEICPKCGVRISGNSTSGEGKFLNSNHGIAIILGYIFAVLGGWIGLVFGLYLITRDEKQAKKHGKIILLIDIVVILLYILLVFGTMSYY
ncbi:MAG: zinc-ribbon domain-containing protein [Methanobacteriaceae archaeon]